MAKLANSDSEALFHSTSRLVNFSDGVMAIAVTLLVLPLVDNISQLQTTSWHQLVATNGSELTVFVLSFVIICRLWIVHHDIFDTLKRFNAKIFWLNALWLLSIVLLPFSTELLGNDNNDSALAAGVYIGTLFVASIAGLLLQWQITRAPDLQKTPVTPRSLIAPAAVTTTLMGAALLLAVLVPAIGPWALCLLFLTGPLNWAVASRK